MGIVVTVKEAQERLPELLARARGGESVVVTENGRSIAEIVAPKDDDIFSRGRAFFAAKGVDQAFPYVSPDFDDPLPESFLWGGEAEDTKR